MNPRTETSPSFSIELFPPKDEAGELRLWEAVDQLTPLSPNFVSVTYGAGGSSRDRTIRIASELTTHTGISTLAHLTCVGSTQEELGKILDQYQVAGISNILALRGDPVGGPSASWEAVPGGFDHADQLVELAISRGDFDVGVAAFPDGHPASGGNFKRDISVLIRKEELGATFATTQFFFEVDTYNRLVEELARAGSNLPIIAGVIPITNFKQLSRMADLSGTPIPQRIASRFAQCAEDEKASIELGIEIGSELCRELISSGAPGIHFYTMNKAASTAAIVKNVGLR